jgi:hypothetical protein
MPFKHNVSRRHRIGKMKFKLTNWPEYEAGLRRRGSLTLWITAGALSCWGGAEAHDTRWPTTLFGSGDRDCFDAGIGFRPETEPKRRAFEFGA